MEAWLSAAIAAGAAVASSALTGLITYRIFRLELRARENGELRAALVAYGAALDRLGLRIGQLPGPPKGMSSALVGMLEHLSTLDWLIGWISRMTVGRGLMRSVDELVDTTNRLAMVAPIEVLEASEAISSLLTGIEGRDEKWKADWDEARGEVMRVSREALAKS